MVIVEAYEGGLVESDVSSFVGELSTMYIELRDHDGAPVDITTGTLTASYVNSVTGSTYTFASGSATLTKVASSVGLLSLLNPNVYPSAARIRLVITLTNGSVVRRFGPVYITVQSL